MKAGYRINVGKQQVMFYCRDGLKAGGWNIRIGHRYVSKVIGTSRPEPMARYDLEFMDRQIEAIAAGHPASDVDALMPWAFTPASS